MNEIYKGYLNSGAGMLEIIASDEGIKSVNFIDQIPDEEFTQNEHVKQCIQQLSEYFNGERQTFSLKLLPDGTPFQMSVWQELQKIPFGTTISYMELAERLNNRLVIRAAGQASGKNRIAIIIPCHRVIGSSGKLTGYAGGLSRKQWLLNHERSLAKNELLLF